MTMSLPSTQDIVDDLAFFDDWEQRYQYIIDLGKSIHGLPEDAKTPDKLVKGCQSSVWLESRVENGLVTFSVWNNGEISFKRTESAVFGSPISK